MQLSSIYFIALLSGVGLAFQVGINATLAKGLNNPFMAALMSFIVGGVGLALIATFIHRPAIPSVHSLQTMPWWVWTGGVLGALYVTSAIVAAPKIGTTQLVAYVITGQMIASLILDHYGLLGFEIKSISIGRIIGVFLLISGTLMIRRF